MSHCPVCGSLNTQLFAEAWDSEYCTTKERFKYANCSCCDTVFIDPAPVDRLAEIYPDNYYSFSGDAGNSFVSRVKKQLDGRLFRRILKSVPGDSITVLDIGGGNGWLLTLIREQNQRVGETHEVDLNDTARPAAEQAGHVFHCMRIEDFTSDLRFDLIVMLNIIEHVSDPAHVLKRVGGLLSDGGYILIKTPNVDTVDCRMFRRRNWGGFHCPRHWVLFTRPGFINLTRRCGLDCVWARYTQGAPQWTTSILGWLADRGFVQVTSERPMHTHPLYMPLAAVTAGLDFVRRPFMPTAQMFVLLRKSRAP